MESYDEILQRLLKTQFELSTGTYKRMSNELRLQTFNKELAKAQRMNKDKTKTQFKQTCTTDCKVGSTKKSFDPKMKPITIKEMTMGNTYKNKYIELEIVTELLIIVSIMFLGKDINGDYVLIAVYNFENHYGTKDYEQLSYIFQKGKYILVLEPFYKMFGSGEDGIRIEDPNEIIIFDDKEWMNKFISTESKEESFRLLHDDDDKNYDSLYKEAYKSFSIENYKMALVHFIKLKTLKPSEIKFDMKIAECYFNIPYYTKVIEKCDEIMLLKDEKFTLDALSLKLKSLLKIKKVKEAKDLVDNNKNLIINNESRFFNIEEEIKRKIKNINGEYDFSEIYEKSKNNFNIDIGEYLNNKIEIRYDKINGISIYSKDKINKGEIILVSKAIIAMDLKNKKRDKNLCIQYDNPDKEEYEKTGQFLTFKEDSELQNKLSYNLSNYPEDFKEFLYLYDGKNKNKNLEERIKSKEIDLKKIQNVLKFNYKILIHDDTPITEGLWLYPSLFNHSCIPNCFQFGFGDILIIIAINDIGKNSELYLNYLNNDIPYDMRQGLLKEKYDFNCCCELCKYENNKFKTCPEKKTLNEYLTKLYNFFINIDNNFEKEKEMSHPTEKEIKGIIKFLEKNKKLFSCYEKSAIYIYCALGMRLFDGYLACDYLELSLKYSENRNYEYEKYTLILLIATAKFLRSDVRYEIYMKKLKEFYEKYFPKQNKFVDILMEKYK